VSCPLSALSLAGVVGMREPREVGVCADPCGLHGIATGELLVWRVQALGVRRGRAPAHLLELGILQQCAVARDAIGFRRVRVGYSTSHREQV